MDKEYKDYSAGTGNPSNTDIVLLQPNPDSGVVGDRIYKKWTWLQLITALGSLFVPKNATITGATKTKITYDSNGLVTAGTDVGFIDITGSVSDNSTLVDYIADPTNINQDSTYNFVTDSEKTTWNGKQNALTDINFGAFANSLTAKTTPIDADLVNIVDTADLNKQKKVTFTNIKAFLKTYFDTLYTGGSGTTNLGYTASPTNGVVTSDTGTDATLPLADGTNAGLLKPDKYTLLENTSGTNTGDETASRIATINHGVTAKTNPIDGDEITGQDSASSFALTRFTFLNAWANYFKGKADAVYLALTGGSLSGVLNLFKGSNIASASTTDIANATGNYINITGTTTITALGTAQAGARRTLNFTGVLTLTHNATSLILPTGANITTATGDVVEFISEGSGNWRCVSYTRANGQALVGSTFTPASQAQAEAVAKNSALNTPTALNNTDPVTPQSLFYYDEQANDRASFINKKLGIRRQFYMIGVGSSHVVGTGSSSNARGFYMDFCGLTDYRQNNKAEGGSGVLRAMYQLCQTDSTTPWNSVDNVSDVLMEAGFNDINRMGGTPRSGFTPATNAKARSLSKIELGWMALLTKVFTKSASAVSASTIVITDPFYRTGTWTTQTAGSSYPSPSELNYSGNGMHNSTLGNKLVYTTTNNPRYIAIMYVVNDQALSGETLGSFDIFRNSTLVATIDTNDKTIGQNGGTTNYPVGHYNNNYTLGAYVIDNFGTMGTTIIEVVNKGNTKIIIDHIAELKKPGSTSQVFCLDIPKMNSTGYTFASDGVTPRDYIGSDSLTDEANEAQLNSIRKFLMFDVVRVETNKNNPNTQMNSDNVHFNDVGHAIIANNILYQTRSNRAPRAIPTLRLANGGANPSANTSYYASTQLSSALVSTETLRRVKVSRNCVLKDAVMFWNFVAGAGSSAIAVYFSKNGTDAFTLDASASLATGSTLEKTTSDINVYLKAGDWYSIRVNTPTTWVGSAPTTVSFTCELNFEYEL